MNIEFEKYKKLALSGDSSAYFHLGFCYEFGYGVEVDIEKAINSYLLSIENGGLCAVKVIEYHIGEHARQIESTIRSSDRISKFDCLGEILNNEGRNILFSKGFDIADNIGLRLMRLSADLNNSSAQAFMGECYLKGTFVDKDFVKALEWFEKSAKDNNPESLSKLIDCYVYVKGGDTNSDDLKNVINRISDAKVAFSLGSKYINSRHYSVYSRYLIAVCCYERAYVLSHDKQYGKQLVKVYLQGPDKDNCINTAKLILVEIMEPYEIFEFGKRFLRGSSTDKRLAIQLIKIADELHLDAASTYLIKNGYKEIKFNLDTELLRTKEISREEREIKIGSNPNVSNGSVERDEDDTSCKVNKEQVDTQVDNVIVQREEEIETTSKIGPDIKLLEELANNGNETSQWQLAELFFKGINVKIDIATAIKWYKRAALLGHEPSIEKLARIYLSGTEVRQNLKIGLSYLSQIKDSTYIYVEGEKVIEKGDFRTGTTYIECSANMGYAKAQSRMGDISYNSGSYDVAMMWYEKAAVQGDKYAQLGLAKLHYFGEGVKVDYTKAVNWLKKAAEQGVAEAQRLLGECYLNGYGVDRDNIVASKYFLQAAINNDTIAQYRIGYNYYYGIGVDKDINNSKIWIGKAADNKYRNAVKFQSNFLET
ncbi:MAG: sel1 repeat family protein [Paludibacteraceae bacterium]|nr:sel1 repeat family protein [Paludibacteraceae bacterium]